MSKKGFNVQSLRKNGFMLDGKFAKRGYDWWWHSFTATDDETGEEVPFFIEYFICNPALKGENPVLAQSDEAKKKNLKPTYLMVKAGAWGKNKKQLHRFYSLSDVKINKSPFGVFAEECSAEENRITGKIKVSPEEAESSKGMMCDSGSMEWDLKLEKNVAYNVGYGTSWLFRVMKAFEMYWHAQGMKTYVSGNITFDGRHYTVKKESSFGYADKNWGCGFTTPWVWLSSNDLVSNVTGKRLSDSVFDIGGGKPRVFGIPLNRKLLSAFWYEGSPYEFNFSKFWTFTKTEFSSEETGDEILWHVMQETVKARMETEIRCKKDDMIFVNYEDPDGVKRFDRLWNGGNGYGNVKLYKKRGKNLELIDDIKCGHVGCEYGEFAR